jgi:poly-gamma-glutamate capsule biosynthesis protein CapA/YwtB (metallophosphatase superfamily)
LKGNNVLYDSEKGNCSIALTGDSMLTRKLSSFTEERYQALVALLHGADACFSNLESTVRGWDEGSPAISRMGRGTFMTTEPWLVQEMRWFGINLLSCANNHAFEFGEEGVLATLRHLDEGGIAHAGTGRNLGEARAPGYLDTPNGRVALIAANATNTRSLISAPWGKAGSQRPDHKGRPGVNPLGFETAYIVDPKAFEELCRIERELGFDPEKDREKRAGESQEKTIDVRGNRFMAGEGFGLRTLVDKRDLWENLKWIRDARRQADWVVVSLHWHEFGGESLRTARSVTDCVEPADFITAFAHAAIDAGADVIAGHGPHVPLGIEIYRGKPIFYSLGNFIFQNETVRSFPADAYERFDLDGEATPADWWDARTDQGKKGHPANPLYWENFVALCQFKEKRFAEARLYPIDQGHGRSRAQRGRPLLADNTVSERVLARLQKLSRPYGTEVKIDNAVGVIAV